MERLLEIEDIYERERKECIHEIDEMINDQHIKNVVMNFVCQKCGSNLVSPIEGLTPLTLMCKSCSDEFEYEKSMVEIISRQYSMRNYVSYKETGTYETYECPNCRNDSFSEEEQICLICGYQKRYEKCWRCGETLTVDEQILEGLCSACNNEYNSLMEDD
ncbi:hypothetical protein [Marispirochaeta sp.]|uniref:hypothetical protein n=1 Tax=Marispirochaeta sp. TaxID=2038653 RepID=UPI0029C8FF12|nr:hypothetical protein [Marispirochaeta sp.]